MTLPPAAHGCEEALFQYLTWIFAAVSLKTVALCPPTLLVLQNFGSSSPSLWAVFAGPRDLGLFSAGL